jgi:ATP synthase protein I
MHLMENKTENTIKNNNISIVELFKQTAKWQFISTFTIAFLAYWVAGLPGTASALIGGGAVLAGGFVASRIARRSENSADSGVVLINMLKAEAAKILLIVLVLWLGFKLYAGHIVPLALVAGLAVAALLSGAGVFALNNKRPSIQTTDKSNQGN